MTVGCISHWGTSAEASCGALMHAGSQRGLERERSARGPERHEATRGIPLCDDMVDDMQAAEGSWPVPVVPITFPTISVWSQRWPGERADWPDNLQGNAHRILRRQPWAPRLALE